MAVDVVTMSNEAEQRWQTLTIANDFVFCKTMLNAELCKEVLEAILGVPIDRVEYIGRQEVLDATPEGKGVRLDVYVRDNRGTVYDVEMQLVNTGELPQRARYYQALMSLDQIKRGGRYRDLKDSYVIFICGFDPFGRGLRTYTFENTCQQDTGLLAGDGAKTMFLVASGLGAITGDDSLGELLNYIANGTVSGELSTQLAGAVAEVLNNEKWKVEFVKLEVRDRLNFDCGKAEGLEQGRNEGLERGRSEGLEQGRAEGLEQGRNEGLEQGRAEGERRLVELITRLNQAGRTDEVPRALEDEGCREGLYRELGIR